MSKRKLKTDKHNLFKYLYKDESLSQIIDDEGILFYNGDCFSLAAHKDTGIIITVQSSDKNISLKKSIMITFVSGTVSYSIRNDPAKGISEGVVKFKSVILLLSQILQGTVMKNVEENISQFRNCTTVLMSILYQNFPNPVNIDTFYIEGKGAKKGERILVNYEDEIKIWNKGGYTSEINPVKDKIIIYKNTIKFLRDEEYIRCSESSSWVAQRIFTECVLTSVGLAVLGKTDVKHKTCWGDIIHAALRDGKYKTIQDIAQKFILEVLLP